MPLKGHVKENKGYWDDWVPYVLFAYNYRDAPQAATGFSPFELLFGRGVRGPLSVVQQQWTGKKKTPQSVVSFRQERLAESHKLARESEEKAKQEGKAWHDKKARERVFKIGSQVLALMPSGSNKLSAQWEGPYTVLKQMSPVSYLIQMPNKRKKERQLHAYQHVARMENIISSLQRNVRTRRGGDIGLYH